MRSINKLLHGYTRCSLFLKNSAMWTSDVAKLFSSLICKERKMKVSRLGQHLKSRTSSFFWRCNIAYALPLDYEEGLFTLYSWLKNASVSCYYETNNKYKDLSEFYSIIVRFDHGLRLLALCGIKNSKFILCLHYYSACITLFCSTRLLFSPDLTFCNAMQSNMFLKKSLQHAWWWYPFPPQKKRKEKLDDSYKRIF